MSASDLESGTSLKELVAALKDLDCQVSETCQYIYGPDFRIKYERYLTDVFEYELNVQNWHVQDWQEFISNHKGVLHQLMDLLFPEASSSWKEREQKREKQLDLMSYSSWIFMHGYPSESFWELAVETVEKVSRKLYESPYVDKKFATKLQQIYRAASHLYYILLDVIGKLMCNPEGFRGKLILSRIEKKLDVLDGLFSTVSRHDPQTLPDRTSLGRELHIRM
jgi:hypothetical protein